ncbi:MAG: hypothetical protein SOY73_14260 [Blautia sp.]|nr:hypothetical protein [Blautia sp.]MDY4000226.1 hypothetical protein [Blautia sp.]
MIDGKLLQTDKTCEYSSTNGRLIVLARRIGLWEMKMPRKSSLDGKDPSLGIRMSAEEKERLVSYAERHYQNTGVSGVALIPEI